MKKMLTLISIFTFAIMLSGCAAKNATQSYSERGYGGVADYEAPSMAMSAPAVSMDEYPIPETKYVNESDLTDHSSVQRIVLKNANLSIVVKDPVSSQETIGKMAEDMGGFIVTSQLYKITTDQGIQVPEGNITIRVPAEKLDEALSKIKAQVTDPKTDILSENVEGQDVTKEYTDLKSRLTNAEQTEKKLQEIMDNATETEDVLSVYTQLIQVHEQIEVLKGQIRYYDEASRLSAISVRIRSQESIAPLTIGGWKPEGIARDALQALINSLKYIANALIWAVIFCLPIGILIGVPGYFIIRGLRRWYLRRKSKKAQTENNP